MAEQSSEAPSVATSLTPSPGIFRSPAFWLIAILLIAASGTAGYALHTTPTTEAMPTTSTTVLSGCALDQTKTYIQILSIDTTPAQGVAVVNYHPVELHCGGPDDRQYNPFLSTGSVTISTSISFTILDQNQNYKSVPATFSQLMAYVLADPDGNIFQVQGPLVTPTGLTAMFHP